MAIITEQDIDDLAVGAAVLGTGGGGDPYIGKLLAKAAIEKYGPVDLIALDAVPDGAAVVACGAMGAPTILIEKIPSGEEGDLALETYEDHTGIDVGAIIPFEAGGINSMIPIVLAAKKRVPVIDADGMGRAFPQLEMETFNVYGVPASPVAVADERGNRVLIETEDAAKAEWLARGVTIRMGGQASYRQLRHGWRNGKTRFGARHHVARHRHWPDPARGGRTASRSGRGASRFFCGHALWPCRNHYLRQGL